MAHAPRFARPCSSKDYYTLGTPIVGLIQVKAEGAWTSYKELPEVPSTGEGYQVQQVETWRRRKAPSLRTSGLKRWLVLLLVLAISTSGLVHVQIGDHAASAASLSHEIAAVGHETTGEPHCAGDADEANGANCCISSVCSFCIPLTTFTATTRTMISEVVAALPDEAHLGCAPSPGFRPPSLSANV